MSTKFENERAHLQSTVCGLEDELKTVKADLTSALSRIEELEGVLQDIAYYDMTDGEKLKDPIDVVDNLCTIARQALSGKEPVEPKEVTREELENVLGSFAIRNPYSLAGYLLSRFTITERRKG